VHDSQFPQPPNPNQGTSAWLPLAAGRY